MMSERRFVFLAMTVIAAVLATLVLTVNGLTHHYDRVNCIAFGESANRQVKFVDWSFWSWACLTPSSDGKWIDAHNLRDVS